jgi:putative serine protease PepD
MLLFMTEPHSQPQSPAAGDVEVTQPAPSYPAPSYPATPPPAEHPTAPYSFGAPTSNDPSVDPFADPSTGWYGDPYARPGTSGAGPAGGSETVSGGPGTPYGLPPYDQSTDGTQPPRRRTGAIVGVVAATALVAAAVGGGVGAAVADHQNNGSTVVTNSLTGKATTVRLPTGSVEAVAAKVLPTVVSIVERSTDGSGGEGSGIILSSDGLILTNNHVVAGAADGGTLQVTFSNNKTVDATTVGRDPSSDLAVVKAKDVSGLTPAVLGSSETLVVGQTVVAVGSPLGLSGTVTSGIVSALDRPVTTGDTSGGSAPGAVLDAIQTDAAINPGNSGGPLVDLAGRVVGINSAIASLGTQGGSSQSGSIGLGFAIPIDQARRIAQQLVANGSATHPQLGVQVADAPQGGALLRSVQPGSAADKAGLKAGDVVTRFGDKTVDSADALVAHVRSSAPGSTVTVTYERGGHTYTTQVTLGQASG